MNVESIRTETIHHMIVDGEEYHRHNAHTWSKTLSYDIHSEEVGISEEQTKILEELYQEYKDLI